jgi:hypothetical protein
MKNKGLVGFFDILGYQNIIQNNHIEYVAELIDMEITVLGKRTKDHLVERLGGHIEPDHCLNSIEAIVVSDSIILFFPYSEIDYNNDWKLFYFLSYVFELLKSAFDAGLPLRGAISYGEYYCNKNTFAGLPIVSSYGLSERLNLSGCIFTEEAAKEVIGTLESIMSRIGKAQNFHKLLFSYLAPLKDVDQKSILLNWYQPFENWDTPESNVHLHVDVRQYVIEKFHAHGKNVSRREVEKLENTERIIRYTKCLNEETFDQVLKHLR